MNSANTTCDMLSEPNSSVKSTTCTQERLNTRTPQVREKKPPEGVFDCHCFGLHRGRDAQGVIEAR